MIIQRKKDSELLIIERRLRPIYTFLLENNAKQALSEAEKLFRKHDMLAAKALAAVSLLRMDRDDEAYGLLESISIAGVAGPLDEHTRHACAYALKEATLMEKLCEVHEAQHRFWKSERSLTQLLISYCHSAKFCQMKNSAMQLGRNFPSRQNTLMRAACVILAAFDDVRNAATIHLPIADKLVSDMEESIPDLYSAYALCALILRGVLEEERGDYMRAAVYFETAAFRTDISNVVRLQNLNDRTVLCRVKTNTVGTREAFIGIYNFVKRNPTNLKYIRMLLQCVFEVFGNNFYGEVQRIDMFAHVLELMDREEERSPYEHATLIFRLECIRLLRLQKKPEFERMAVETLKSKGLSTYVEQVFEYFERFYKSPCVFEEMIQYILSFTSDERTSFLTLLNDYKKEVLRNTELVKDNQDLYILAFELEVFSLLNVNKLDSVENRDEWKTLLRNILGYIGRCGNNGQLSLRFVAMLINELWPAYAKHNDTTAFGTILLVLELYYSFNKSLSVHFTLARLYAHVGVLLTRHAGFEYRLKTLQHDSLGYSQLNLYHIYGDLITGLDTYREGVRAYITCYHDALEALYLSLQHGQYEYMREAYKVCDGLRRSSHRCMYSVYLRWIQAIMIADYRAYISTFLNGNEARMLDGYTEFADNRNMNYMIVSSGSPEEKEEMRKQTLDEEVDYMRLLDFFMRAAGVVLQSKEHTDFVNIVNDIEPFVNEMKEKYSKIPDDHFKPLLIQTPIGPRVRAFLVDSSCADLCIYMLKTYSSNAPPIKKFVYDENILNDLLDKLFPKEPIKLLEAHEAMSYCTRAVQAICYCRLIFDNFHSHDYFVANSSVPHNISFHEGEIGLLKALERTKEVINNRMEDVLDATRSERVFPPDLYCEDLLHEYFGERNVEFTRSLQRERIQNELQLCCEIQRQCLDDVNFNCSRMGRTETKLRMLRGGSS